MATIKVEAGLRFGDDVEDVVEKDDVVEDEVKRLENGIKPVGR